jgi:hypothetical protein
LSPADVTAVRVGGTRDPDLAALSAALTALLPATTNVCTNGQTLAVPLKGPDRTGRFHRASKRVSLSAKTAAGNDGDRLKLTCVPHGWPMHGPTTPTTAPTGRRRSSRRPMPPISPSSGASTCSR